MAGLDKSSVFDDYFSDLALSANFLMINRLLEADFTRFICLMYGIWICISQLCILTEIKSEKFHYIYLS